MRKSNPAVTTSVASKLAEYSVALEKTANSLRSAQEAFNKAKATLEVAKGNYENSTLNFNSEVLRFRDATVVPPLQPS